MNNRLSEQSSILTALILWREEDHEDFITLSRNEVIELIEELRDEVR